jgi:glycosyltransferase involved in cell wall biosynthesis
MTQGKKNVLFVGSFISSGKDGSVGGQMYACKQIFESEYAQKVNWILIDSTAENISYRNFINKLTPAIRRMSSFVYHLIFSKVDSCLIFTADGLSFYEKGSMAIIGRLFFKKIFIAPRSGFIKRDLEETTILKHFIPFVFRFCDKIICQGRTWKEYFESKISIKPQKYLVLNNWTDTSNFTLSPQYPKGQQIYILFLAWVYREKGIFDLIDAARDVVAAQPDVIFLIGGEGRDFQLVQEKVIAYGLEHHFQFLGWILGDEKKKYLQMANIFVLPSYAEGFPNSLIEAILFENAVLASNVGSIADVIKHEKNGFLFEAGHIPSITKYLLLLVNNETLRKEFALKAKEDVIQNHSAKKIIPQLIDNLINV